MPLWLRWSSFCRSENARRTEYLTEEYILSVAQVFDYRREHQSADCRDSK
ncbi:hypothetical protein COMA1_80017 [Candidatus Nitrospira nitrosa]|uniref:Uncharacterized protein n=1 Tax=Candidatus Nitrospira nitrosa TaxID=1742972 RepID=A0A0S4LPC8_9BACT|nr:hypothetical protein COMA1_80017 [Candidatus Nitrospira nitrosa]